MTDLPDEMQREFEVKPGVKQITFTVLWVDKGQRYTHVQVYPLARILGALKKWHQKVADSDETPRCLICDTGLLQDTGQNPKAFVVGFSDTKIRVPGRTALLIAPVCTDCAKPRSDDNLIEAGRKKFAPASVPLAEGNA